MGGILKEFVKLVVNKNNKQNSLIIKKKKLKEFNLDIDDLLVIEINKKKRGFR